MADAPSFSRVYRDPTFKRLIDDMRRSQFFHSEYISSMYGHESVYVFRLKSKNRGDLERIHRKYSNHPSHYGLRTEISNWKGGFMLEIAFDLSSIVVTIDDLFDIDDEDVEDRLREIEEFESFLNEHLVPDRKRRMQ